jgi:all-trans-8'-apo-beta-carotenal 15,15'-oxygenase
VAPPSPAAPANTALVAHKGELLALWEGGAASALHPETLAYLGPHTLGGAARVAPAFSLHPALDEVLGVGGDAVCAHSHRCPATGRLVMLMSRYALGSTTLRFVEFAADGWTVHSQRTHVVDGFTHVHDFVVTPSSYVFFQPRLAFDAIAFRRGRGALDSVAQDPGPTHVVALPRAPGFATRAYEAPRWYATHFINAYETPAELVVECFGTHQLGSGMEAFAFQPRRLVIDTAAGLCLSCTALDVDTSEFPALPASQHGQPHTAYYYSGTRRTPMDSWVRVDARTGARRYSTACPGFHLEPVLCANDEFLVGFVLQGDAQLLRVLEAATMREVAAVPVTGTNTLGLHGFWAGSTGAPTGAPSAPAPLTGRQEPCA